MHIHFHPHIPRCTFRHIQTLKSFEHELKSTKHFRVLGFGELKHSGSSVEGFLFDWGMLFSTHTLTGLHSECAHTHCWCRKLSWHLLFHGDCLLCCKFMLWHLTSAALLIRMPLVRCIWFGFSVTLEFLMFMSSIKVTVEHWKVFVILHLLGKYLLKFWLSMKISYYVSHNVARMYKHHNEVFNSILH